MILRNRKHAGGAPEGSGRTQTYPTEVDTPRLYRAASINGKATGQTLIVPARSGKRFVVAQQPIVELTTVSGAGTPPSIRIGNNGTWDNITAITALAALTTSNQLLNVSLISGWASLDVSSTGISVDVQTAATLYTTYTFSVTIVGFYY